MYVSTYIVGSSVYSSDFIVYSLTMAWLVHSCMTVKWQVLKIFD